MATKLNGIRIAQVAGDVKYTGATGLFKMITCKPGLLALYKLASDSFFVHTIVPGQIRKPAKLQISRQNVVKLHIRETSCEAVWPSGSTVLIRNANKVELEKFVNALQIVQYEVSNAPPKLAAQKTPVSSIAQGRRTPINQSRTIKKELASTSWSPTAQKYQNSPIKNCTSSYSSASPNKVHSFHEKISSRDELLHLDSPYNKELSPQKTPTESGPWLRKPSVKSSRKEDIENWPNRVNGSSSKLKQTRTAVGHTKRRRRKLSLNGTDSLASSPLVTSSDDFLDLPTSVIYSPECRKALQNSTNSPSNHKNSSPKKRLTAAEFFNVKPKPSFGLWGSRRRPPGCRPSSTQSPKKTYLSPLASSKSYNKSSYSLSVDSFGDDISLKRYRNLQNSPASNQLAKTLLPSPLSNSQSFYREPSFEDDIAPLKGFSNLGNTCYMNAILQSLLGLTTFAHDLSNETLQNRISPDSLCKRLYQLFCCKKSNSSMEIQRLHLKKLKSTISAAATRFSGYLQHDAHEFLCQVLEQIKDDAESLSKTSSKQLATMQCCESLSPISRNFDCHILHIIICRECGEKTTKEEIFRDFSLDIPNLCSVSSPQGGAIKIEELIERFFKDELVEYCCKECECKEATVSHRITKLPRILILHLKRYGYDRGTDEQAKKKDNISITKSIDIGKLCSAKVVNPLKFELSKEKKRSAFKTQEKSKRPQEVIDITSASKATPSARRKLLTTIDKVSSAPSSDSENDLIIVPDCNSTPRARKRLNEDCCPVKQTNSQTYAKKTKLTDSSDSDCTIYGKNVSELTEKEQLKWALEESKHITADGSEKKTLSSSLKEVDQSEIISNDDVEECISIESKGPLDYVKKVDSSLSDSLCRGKATSFTRKRLNQNCSPVRQTSSQSSSKETSIMDSSDSDCTVYGKNVSELTEEEQLKWALEESKHITADCSKKKTLSSSSKEVDLSKIISDDDVGRFISLESKGSPVLCEKVDSNLSNSLCRDRAVSSSDRGNNVKSNNNTCIESSVSSTTEINKGLNSKSKEVVAVSDSESDSKYFSRDEIAQAIAQSLEVKQYEEEADEEMKKALEISLQDYEKNQGVAPLEEYDSGFVSPETNKGGIQEIDLSVCQSPHEYRLVSVVSHIGQSSTSGHYISDVYDCKNKQWMSYNDSTVEKVTEHEVRYSRCNTGYIFFYQDKQSVEGMEQSTALRARITNV